MTEKNYNPQQKERKSMEKQGTKKNIPAVALKEKKKDEKKIEIKKEEKKSEKPKTTEAVIYGKSLPMSTKKSVAVCKFIKGKPIQKALSDLEQVLTHKKVVPMKGEIPHQKGKKISSGGYPKKVVDHFIKLLKSLQANANVNGLEEPKIIEAMANLASRPYGKFGRVRKKRTHVKIKVREKKHK